MVHWEIDAVTYLRDTSQLSRWRWYNFYVYSFMQKTTENIYIRRRFIHILEISYYHLQANDMAMERITDIVNQRGGIVSAKDLTRAEYTRVLRALGVVPKENHMEENDQF